MIFAGWDGGPLVGAYRYEAGAAVRVDDMTPAEARALAGNLIHIADAIDRRDTDERHAESG